MSSRRVQETTRHGDNPAPALHVRLRRPGGYGDPEAGTFRAGLVVRSTEDTSGVGSSATSYTYDLLNRLTNVARTGANAYQESYTWDDNDNRLSVTKDGVTTAATYDRANQLTTLGSTSYTYDRNGNARAYGDVSLSYDAANKWTGGSVGTTSLAFTYDAFGRRVSRTVAGAETEYWYDATGLAQETGPDGQSFLRSPGGALLARDHTATGITVNYGTDRQGSVTALTDTDTSLDNTYSYDVWGGIVRATGARINPLRYVGGYHDSATDLYQMNARYYQPGAGRFTQQDPLGSSVLQANRYGYTSGDPVNYEDPSGLCPVWSGHPPARRQHRTAAAAAAEVAVGVLLALPLHPQIALLRRPMYAPPTR